MNITFRAGNKDENPGAHDDETDNFLDDWRVAAEACERKGAAARATTQAGGSSSSGSGNTGLAVEERPQPEGKTKTVDRYPRLPHPFDPEKHYIRLVENEALDIYDMRAFCAKHPGCTMNRRSRKRPLGLLWAWLSCADMYKTKEDHKRACNMPPYEERREARCDLCNMGSAASWLEAEAIAYAYATGEEVAYHIEFERLP